VFRVEPVAEQGYRFIAEIHLRVGPLAARLNRRELDAVREHMRVEGINLKRFVERRHDEHAGAVASTRSDDSGPGAPSSVLGQATPGT
jgi:hypothetical protein